MLWTGPEGLAVGGLYLNKPNLFAVTLNIPTFICHFLMRLKWANTNQGFRDSVLTSLYEYLCPADNSDSLLNSKFSLQLPGVNWGVGEAEPEGGSSASHRFTLGKGLDTSST